MVYTKVATGLLVVLTQFLYFKQSGNKQDNVSFSGFPPAADSDIVGPRSYARHLEDEFWNDPPEAEFFADNNGSEAEAAQAGQHVQQAGHMVNATEAAAQSATGEHLFMNLADVPAIQEFFTRMVSGSNALYEGSWVVTDTSHALDGAALLNQAFGNDENDPSGINLKGRTRAFLYKNQQTESSLVDKLFATSTETDDESEDHSSARLLQESAEPEEREDEQEEKEDQGEEREEPQEREEEADEPQEQEQEKEQQKEQESSKGKSIKAFKQSVRGKIILFDGHYREREIDLFFALSPKADFGQTLSIQKLLPDGEVFNATTGEAEPDNLVTALQVKDALLGIQIKHRLNLVDEQTTRVDITIQECAKSEQLESTCLEFSLVGRGFNATDSKGNSVELFNIFPRKMQLRLSKASLGDYLANISNYSFMTTLMIVLAFFSLLSVIKQVTQNHALAQSISPVSVGVNLVWNFFFFAINFQFSIQGEGEFMQYLGMPAFWYFICSFTFESRLFILVWRAQLSQREMFDEQYLRKRLTWFYILFYMMCFTAVVFQTTLLYETWAILLFNSSLFIPQIIHTYILRSRKGPSVQFAVALFAMQSFMPLYLKMDSGNFLDQEPETLNGMLIICFMSAQLLVMKLQQTQGPRWFIPKRFRRNPFAHNYFRNVPESVLARAKLASDPTAFSNNEEDVQCAICMNYVYLQVTEHGEPIRLDAPQAQEEPIARNSGLLSSINAWLSVTFSRVQRVQPAAQQAEQELADLGERREESPTEETLVQEANNTELLDQSESPEIELDSQGGEDLESQPKREEENATTTETKPKYQFAKKMMVTPCNHSYHIFCLKKWMDIRLECPTCRQAIPIPDDD